MKYLHWSLHFSEGECVEVTVNEPGVCVRLMDDTNFKAYKAGQRFQYHGGVAQRERSRLAPPQPGRWHVCADMNGRPGRFKATAKVVQPEALVMGENLGTQEVPGVPVTVVLPEPVYATLIAASKGLKQPMGMLVAIGVAEYLSGLEERMRAIAERKGKGGK